MVGARALGIFSAVDRLGMVMRERKRRMRRMDVLRMERVRGLSGRGCTWELEQEDTRVAEEFTWD